MAVAPLTVCTGLIQPQPPGRVLLHCTDQLTPPGAASFATVALTGACVAAVIVAGGACLKVSVGDGTTTVVRATAEFDGVDAGEDAVIVTRPPGGTEAGAV